jgi:hypothetical protein
MLYLLLFEKKERKKEKGETLKGLLPRAGVHYWVCHAGISGLLSIIKNCFKSQPLNFMCA